MGSSLTNNLEPDGAGASSLPSDDYRDGRKNFKIFPVASKAATRLARMARQRAIDEQVLNANWQDETAINPSAFNSSAFNSNAFNSNAFNTTSLSTASTARAEPFNTTPEPAPRQSVMDRTVQNFVKNQPVFDQTAPSTIDEEADEDNVYIVGDWVANTIPCLIRGIDEDSPILSIRYPRGTKRRYFTHHNNQLTKVETVLGDEDKEKTRVMYTKDLTTGTWHMTLDGITSRLPGEISLSDTGVFHVQVDNTGRCRREYPDGTISVDMACSAHHKGAHALVQALMSDDDGSGGSNNRTVLDLLSVVSHDLRSPLTSVQGLLTLLSAGAFGAIPDKARERIASVESDLTRLTRLINELLDAEMLVSGKLIMRRQLIDVQDLFDAAVGSLSGLALQQKVQLSVIKSNLQLHADKDRLVRVLVNIVANAIKYSPKGATVVLSAEFNGDSVILRVKDSGRGIPTKFQKTIFERYQQVSEGDWSEKGGVGLGLAISKSIVEAHGGSIGVESMKGAGSTFWVSIPVTAFSDLT